MSFETTVSDSLAWCQRTTGPYPEEARVTSIDSRQWLSGSAFCAILHATDPASLDYDELHQPDVEPTTRLRVCFELAEKQYGVAPVLDAGDWAALSAPEPKSLMLYVQALVPKLKQAMGEADEDEEEEEEAADADSAHLARESKGPTATEGTEAAAEDMPPNPPRKRRVKKKTTGTRISGRKRAPRKSLAAKRSAKVDVTITTDDIGKQVWCNGGSKGVIRFVGSTEFSTGRWVGVEFNQPIGKNDGHLKGVSYFSCKPKHGSFLRPSSVRFADLRAHRASLTASPKKIGFTLKKAKAVRKSTRPRKSVLHAKATTSPKKTAKKTTKKSKKAAISKTATSASAGDTAPSAPEPETSVASHTDDDGTVKAPTVKKKPRKTTLSASKKRLTTTSVKKAKASPPKRPVAKKATIARKKTIIGARSKKTGVARKATIRKKSLAKKATAGRKSSVASRPAHAGRKASAKKSKHTKAKAKGKKSEEAAGAEAPPLPAAANPLSPRTEF